MKLYKVELGMSKRSSNFIFDPQTDPLREKRTGIKHVVAEGISANLIPVDLSHLMAIWELC